jgi:hypothetical protein
MLIKKMVKDGKTKKGVPVPYTAEESVIFAVQYGLRVLNTPEKIYWSKKESLKVDDVSSTPFGKDGWRASAKGSVLIGYTEVKTDCFFEEKLHTFYVEYANAKDSLGLPDIQVSLFKTDLLSTNPSSLMGFKDLASDKASSPKKEEPKKEEAKK